MSNSEVVLEAAGMMLDIATGGAGEGESLESMGMHLITLPPYGVDMRPANHVLSLQVFQCQCLVSLSLRMMFLPLHCLTRFPHLCAYTLISAVLHKDVLLTQQLLSSSHSSFNTGLCPASERITVGNRHY